MAGGGQLGGRETRSGNTSRTNSVYVLMQSCVLHLYALPLVVTFSEEQLTEGVGQ